MACIDDDSPDPVVPLQGHISQLDMHLSRRSLISSAGAIAGLVAVGSGSKARSADQGDSVDVVVIGGGLSGLISARELKKAGHSVTLLEAKDRIGGRMVNQGVAGDGVIDLGGQWGGKTQYRFEALTDELGLKRYPSYYDGKGVFLWNGRSYATDLFSDFDRAIGFSNPDDIDLPEQEKEAALALWKELFEIAKTISVEKPWTSPNAEDLDATPVSQWLADRNASPLAQWMFGWICRGGGAQVFEPYEASMLHLAWTMAAAPPSEVPEDWLLYKGAGEVSKRLAAELGSDVILNAPVFKIDQDANGLSVMYGDGATLKAKVGIVAIPPVRRLSIQFNPPLSPRFVQLMQRTPMPSKWKVLAVYPTAFWRDQGFCAAGSGNLEVLEQTADACPPSGTPGIIASFVSGNRIGRFSQLSHQDQEALVLKDLVAFWGKEAGQPIELVIKRWTEDPWLTGGYGLTRTPGAWTAYGSTWQDPHGKVFWAGTEQSTRWPGYFEGAIEAGIAAAQRANAVLA